MRIERVLGAQYPISVGTALIFESEYFDPRSWPNLFYINLRTLFRNYVASIPTDKRHRVRMEEAMGEFFMEVSEVERIVKEVTNNRVKIFFYYPEYELDELLPKINVAVDYNPDEFDDVEVNLWDYADRKKLVIPFFYQKINDGLPAASEPILLLSSFVNDLLYVNRFPLVVLIESFTGKMKKRQEWWTKINLGKVKNLSEIKIPFCRFTLQVFGDKSGAFRGQDKEVRKAVRDLAVQCNWTPATTTDKIRSNLSKIKDIEIRNLLKTLL